MISIKTSLAIKYALRRTRLSKKAIQFNDAIKLSETAVFLMPRMSMEFYLARSVVESLMRYFRRAAIVVTENMRELATYKLEVIVITQSDQSWLGLPSRDLISRLKNEHYDLAFDLTFSDDVFMSYLSRKSDAKVCAGFSKTNGDHFYDLLIKVPENGEMKKAYDSLINTIKMFKEK
jgi:hypothetical protein